MSVAVYAGTTKVSKDPNANIAEAIELLRCRPIGGKAHSPRRTAPIALPDRRAWGERLAQLVAAISKIQVANERLSVMIDDARLYRMVVARRIERHAA